MRFLQRLFSIALLSVFLTALAEADTMASLTWTDIGSLQGGASYSVGDYNYSVLQSNAVAWTSQTGPGGGTTAFGHCYGDLGVQCNSEFIFDQTFTVTSPGMFALPSSWARQPATKSCPETPDQSVDPATSRAGASIPVAECGPTRCCMLISQQAKREAIATTSTFIPARLVEALLIDRNLLWMASVAACRCPARLRLARIRKKVLARLSANFSRPFPQPLSGSLLNTSPIEQPDLRRAFSFLECYFPGASGRFRNLVPGRNVT
jgi:hypothetical protein